MSNENSMRDIDTESLDTQLRIVNICTPCQWSWDMCPNTMCVLAIRRGRTRELMRVLGEKLNA